MGTLDGAAIDEVPCVVAKTLVVLAGSKSTFSVGERSLCDADGEDEADERSGQFHGSERKNGERWFPG